MDEAARLGLLALRGLLRAGRAPRSVETSDADPGPHDPGALFLLRRWIRDLDDRVRSADTEPAAMTRAARRLSRWSDDDATDEELVAALTAWAAAAEARSRYARASEILSLAASLQPHDPALVLHRGRIARKADRPDEARALYQRTAELAGADEHLTRMASVGEAIVAPDAERALGRALREALQAEDREAAGVVLEARARIRRSAGDASGAVRDFASAAIRFCDPTDRGRVLHEAADLLIAEGSTGAAREVLRAAHAVAHPRQAERAAARLHALAREAGDELGQRRWAGYGAPELVSLGPGPSLQSPPTRAARHVARLRREWAPADR